MKNQGYGKIIQLSGGGATNPMPNLSSYAVAKAGVVRFIETLALEVAKHNVDVNAIAPGALNTRMLEEVIDSGPEKIGKEFYEKALKQKASGGAGLERGAKLAVFLGSADSDGISGKLISALWDPWEDLAQHKDDLASSDIYALRRIVPEDRGQSW
jgi:NAD(P)-dependent dehydrogenase (short-subunit alcohol dehydrogenase family)